MRTLPGGALIPFSASPFQDQAQDAQARREPRGHVPMEALVTRALQRYLHHRYGLPLPDGQPPPPPARLHSGVGAAGPAR